MVTDERTGTEIEPNPMDSPFELPPIEGIPFDKDSEEARAIERVKDEAEREH